MVNQVFVPKGKLLELSFSYVHKGRVQDALRLGGLEP
jgi:hypothetical protein